MTKQEIIDAIKVLNETIEACDMSSNDDAQALVKQSRGKLKKVIKLL